MWTYEIYSQTISLYLDAGYQVGSFEEYLKETPDKFVVLRHDIDFDPSILLPMLEVEKAQGVSSTSFFRVAARGYNLLSAPVFDLLKVIRDLGSSAGLHLDIGMEHCWGKSLHDSADLQMEVFSAVAPDSMRGFSLHQPTNNGGYEFADELVTKWGVDYHAYDRRFFKEMKYLSDSGGSWREGHWAEKVNQFNRLQVLTHPVWHHNGVAQRSF